MQVECIANCFGSWPRFRDFDSAGVVKGLRTLPVLGGYNIIYCACREVSIAVNVNTIFFAASEEKKLLNERHCVERS